MKVTIPSKGLKFNQKVVKHYLFHIPYLTWFQYNINNNVLQLNKLQNSSTLAWKIPWMEEPGRLESMGLLRVGHD